MDFILNRYDPYVANKMINGKQCTICWYVDDTQISHIDPKVVTSVITKIEERFGKMVVTRGKKHIFVGMDVEFMENGTVRIMMKYYIIECFEAFDEQITKSANTPSKHNLFTVDKESPPLDEGKEVFHHIVEKRLYVSKRERVDIDLAVSYLCTSIM